MLTVLTFIFTSAESCNVQERAPKTGKITSIDVGLTACYPEYTPAGERPAVAISYKPAGTDPDGNPWSTAFVCVTQNVAGRYEVGDTYP